MRDALNEDGNNKIIERHHQLAQRKQQIGEMDARIQQLQERLRKKRQIQAVQQENHYNILANNNMIKSKRNMNVAAVEPYVVSQKVIQSNDMKVCTVHSYEGM